MTFLADLHPWNVRLEMRQLKRQWDFLALDLPPQAPRPMLRDPPVPRPARVHLISSCFATMAADEAERRNWRMDRRPHRAPASTHGPHYILHLYSGRRRQNDFQAHMQALLDSGPPHVRAHVVILSIDTHCSP